MEHTIGDDEGTRGIAVDDTTANISDHTPFAKACLPDAPRFIHELSPGPVARASIARNRQDLELAVACTPSGGDDVVAHVDRLKVHTGFSRGLVRTYADIGTTLTRLPGVAEVLRCRNHLSLEHLRSLARATKNLPDEHLEEYEVCVLSLIVPEVHRQALRGWRSFYERLQEIIEIMAPRVRPRNIDPKPTPFGASPPESIHTESGNDTTFVTATLDKIRAFEIFETLDAIAFTHHCDRVEALTHLIRGRVDTRVTLNLYMPVGGVVAWEPTLGMLDGVATERFLENVTKIRVLRDGKSDSYHPTAAQRAFVIARDGTCRFPNCEVPASACQLDHIREYNRKDPADGGPTDTENLHCLCTRHHLLKTYGLWNVSRNSDSTEVWRSSKDGTECVTVPHGPAARHGRITFAEELEWSTTLLREFNDARIARMEQEAIDLEYSMRVFEWDRERFDAEYFAEREQYGLTWERDPGIYPDSPTRQTVDSVIVEVPLPWPLDPAKIRQAEKEAKEARDVPEEEKIPF